jgi:hypothetical protein
MPMQVLRAAIVAISLLAAASCARGAGAPANASAAPYKVLDDQASQLRTDFNQNVGSVRLLFVVDPICPTCLRGLDDMNRDLLAGTSDPRIHTFVVHEPVLGLTRVAPWLRPAGGSDVAKAEQLLHNPNVEHYWSPSGEFGRLLSHAVGLRNSEGPVYAWDVWLLYGPEAKWEGTDPPRPRLLMQQLGALRGSPEFPHFDSHAFAQQVRTLLAQLPSSATPALASSPQ